MKKNIIILAACLAVLIAAGGAYAALMLTDGGDSSSSSETEESSEIYVPVALFEFDKKDIEYVSVKNSEGTFKAVPVTIPAEGEDEEDDITLVIEGYEDLEPNTSLASGLMNSSAALNSESTVEENPENIEKYGLKEPAAEVTVKASTGEKTILLGDESPMKGQTYCKEKGADAVYLISTGNISAFLESAERFISTDMLRSNDGDDAVKIEKLSINREDLDYDIVLEYDKSSEDSESKSGTLATHCMTEPIFAYLDSEKSQTAAGGFFGLSAQSVLSAHPDKNEIKAAGLEKPFCTVTMKTDEPKEYVLKLGSKFESEYGDSYPAMIDNTDIIYAVSPDSVCWAELMPGDITSKMVFGTYVWDIGSLDIEVSGGEKVQFKGSGKDQDDYTVTKNGKSCETERFRSFYTFLLKTSAEEFVIDEKAEGTPIVSVSLKTQDGRTSQTVEFYKSGNKALISVNGTPCFKCRMGYVDLLKDNLSKFDSGEEFVMNW